MYNMVTIVKTVLHISKLLKGEDLKSSLTRKNVYVW